MNIGTFHWGGGKRVLTCQLHRSACEYTRGMTCASLAGQGDSGSLHQKAVEIENTTG